MKKEQLEELLIEAINASIDAGKAILKVYETDFNVEIKDDKSPLTMADQQSHQVISKQLSPLDLPILSEEGKSIEFEERSAWEYFWMVDPLDGTKEFIKRNGEFTVNIALMHRDLPVFGIIYVPVTKTLYAGGTELKSLKINNVDGLIADMDDLSARSRLLPEIKDKEQYTIVGSKSHPSPETQQYIEEISAEKGEVDVVSMGSSLKLCLVAEGVADAYPRFAPTMEWDTAAGQAIVEGSGATVINWETKKRMTYNKENLLNSWFLAKRV